MGEHIERYKTVHFGVIYHTPKDLLNDKEIKMIKSSGLIHFCEADIAKRIIREGVKGGLQRAMRETEKGFTWLYINDEKNFNIKIDLIHKKGYRKKYDSYVVIKDLEDEEIEKLRIRRKLDGAVIYPGDLFTKNMKSYPIN